MSMEEDDDASLMSMEEDDDAVERPEELINHYVRLLTATANITSGLGTLALLWSTVVLLGGFVSVLGIKEFWVLTSLSFLMAFRVVENYDNEFKKGIYLEEAKIFAFIGRQKWIHVAMSRSQRFFLGMVLVPKSIILMCIVALSFNVMPFVSIGILVWRLVRRDYGNAGGDVANTAKLNAALDIFYVLVLFQSSLVLYWVTVDVTLKASLSEVERVTSKQCGVEKWSPKLIAMYCSETKRKFNKDGKLPSRWNLIAYGIELLQSASGYDDLRWGARVLDKLLDEDKTIRQELLSSRVCIQNLMGMIGWRGATDDGIENRDRAARIVARLASDLHITRFPGTLQCICSLLESTSSCEPKLHACPFGNPDEQVTLLADENEQHGSLEIAYHQDADSDAQMDMVVPTITDQTDQERQVVAVSSSSSGLTAKRKTTTLYQRVKKALVDDNPTFRQMQIHREARTYSESKYHRSYKSSGAKELISQGLLILERLTQDEGNCTEISKDQRLLSKIIAPLIRSTSNGNVFTKLSNNTTVEMLRKSLTVLSRLLTSLGDDATRLRKKLASNTEVVSNLMGILENDREGAQGLQGQALDILAEFAFDGSFNELDFDKLFKALLHIFVEKEVNITIVQEPRNATAQVEQADIEKATRLKGRAAEALARLLPLGTARCTLSKQKAISVFTMMLNAILSSKMGTSADTSIGPGGSNSRGLEITIEGSQHIGEADTDTVQPPAAKENEKKSEERKYMSAILSLAVVIYNENVIGKKDYADCYATPENDEALSKKLKEILDVNKNSTAKCLRIVKLICHVVIAMINVKPSCIQSFNGHNFKEALAEALETMSEIDHCMLFAGNDREVIKPARSLASLVREAKELLQTA